MIPQLYTLNSSGGPSIRIGALHQALTCEVTQEINGEYALTLTLPINADHWSSLVLGNGIKAIPQPGADPQMFTIQSRRRSIGGVIEVYAVHQSYIYNSVMVSPFLNGGVSRSASWALYAARDNAVGAPSGMSVGYHRAANPTGSPHLLTPCSLRSYLLEDLAVNWGGEFRFTGLSVAWVDALGSDRGARIAYGGNLLALEEELTQEYESGIYPFYGEAGSADRPLVEISGKVYNYPGVTLPLKKIVPVDMTDRFELTPTAEQLLDETTRYAAARILNRATQALTVQKVLQKGEKPIWLGDTIEILFDKFGIRQKRRVKRMIFDVLKERVKTVELGEMPSTLASTILGIVR